MLTILINDDRSIHTIISEGSTPPHPPELTLRYDDETSFQAKLPDGIRWPDDIDELIYDAEEGWQRDPELSSPPPKEAPTPPSSETLLAEAKAEVRERLRDAAQQRIMGGFTSSALGSPHDYQSALTDQANLYGVLFQAMSSVDTAHKTWDIWCMNRDSQATQRMAHNARQLQILATDMAAHIRGAQDTHVDALARLDVATTPEEAEAVSLDALLDG